MAQQDKMPIQAEIHRLETKVSKGIYYLSVVAEQMQRVERELHAFLRFYHTEVGALFTQLHMLHKKLGLPAAQDNASTLTLQSFNKANTLIERESKTLYRTLIKKYHPDIARHHGYSTRIVQLLNDAYNKRNLHALRLMEHSLTEHETKANSTPKETMARLQARYDAIADCARGMLRYKKTIERSSAWQLKQRIEAQPGLLQEIVIWVKQQIARMHAQFQQGGERNFSTSRVNA